MQIIMYAVKVVLLNANIRVTSHTTILNLVLRKIFVS